MTTATATTTDYTAWDVQAYSGLLEDCTGYTVQITTDAEGEPWYFFADVVADTLDAIEAQLKTERGA